jgi:FeS assembly SUF system regulator
MIRMSKMTDYGIVLLSQLARDAAGTTRTARELAEQTRVPLPSVSKVLKELSQAGLLFSHRGSTGGYSLARPAAEVSMAQVITALEGPVAMTECADKDLAGTCELESTCPMRSHWHTINRTIHDALDRLKLSDITHPATGQSLQAPSRTT